MMEGCQVEISYKNNGFKNVWYKAIIEAKPKSRLRLLKDYSWTLLTELTHKAWFRPIPPKYVQARIDIKEGSIVDTDHNDAWWTGLVVKQIEDDKCLVLFDSPPDIIQFERKHLRPHLDWLNGKWWVLPRRYVQESMFSSGKMVEVSSKINKAEVVWVPAMIIKEIKENDEKKYIVKVCDNPLSFKGFKARPNIIVDLPSVRPTPPPSLVEEYQYVEVFHGTAWRQGRVMGILPRRWCIVLLEAINMDLTFKLSDVRPSKFWEDGVWKSRESPLPQGSVDKMGDSVMNAKESGPPVTPSPGITETPLKQTPRKTFPDKTLPRDQNGSGDDSTLRENGTSEDNNRKRKRDLSSVAIDEEYEAKDITMVLPFEKKLPIWKTFESMEVFKIFPQSPHFSPLVETREDSREMSAVGMMLTFSGLLEEVKDLQPISSLNSLNDSFAELKKHGFDVKVPELRISKLLSLRDSQAKKMEELKGAEKVTAEKESIKVENKRKILELQRLNEEVDKEIAQSKSSEETIVQQLKDAELQFRTTVSAPW